MGGRKSNRSSANTSLCIFPLPVFFRTMSCFTWSFPYRGDRSTYEDVSFCAQPATGLVLKRVWMTTVAKLKVGGQRGMKGGVHGVNRAPEHEGRISSWVWHKLLALEQSLEDEVRVWELCLGYGGFALNAAGVGVAGFADVGKVDVVQRTISFAKVVAIADICSRRMREIVVEAHNHLTLEPLANSVLR